MFDTEDGKESYLAFRVECLNANEINRICQLLQSKVDLSEKNLQCDSIAIVVDEKLVLDVLLPQFKLDIEKAFAQHPEDFRSYQLYSRVDF